MLTIYKDGKIYKQAKDENTYIPSYEVERLKENTPYNVADLEEGGLIDGIKES